MSINFTTEDLEAIEAAIATGALRVEYNDRTVVYRNLKDMFSTRDLIKRCLGLTKRSGRILCTTKKGTC